MTSRALPKGQSGSVNQTFAALVRGLRESERAGAAPHETLRRQSLGALLRHARQTVPFYRDRLQCLFENGPEPDLGRWHELPLLRRRDIQTQPRQLLSRAVPADHGGLSKVSSTGSTGRPIDVIMTRRANLFASAILARDHEWHQRDRTRKVAAIQHTRDGVADYPKGQAFPVWEESSKLLGYRAPSVQLSIQSSVADQLEWLIRQAPDYLVTYPTNLGALAETIQAFPDKFFPLSGISTLSEILPEETRAAARQVWGVEISDIYSCKEAGVIALQCPAHRHYHCQSEVVIVEILDEDDRPAAPGRAGRVVVTPLHNYAMPLIRYEVGDYAVPGAACDCGRTLPVLARILGRTRNMFHFSDGTSHWPVGNVVGMRRFFAFEQMQIVQTALDEIELRYVGAADPGSVDMAALTAHIHKKIHPSLRVRLKRLDEIPRGAGGKFEDAISLVETAR